MREPQKYLKERWSNELPDLHTRICRALRIGKDLKSLSISKTEEGLIDLRGFSAPKEYAEHLSNKGNKVKYVKDSIRIKKQKFSDFDFSFSDFEQCTFTKCDFSNSKFYKTRFRECDFHSCTFSNINFDSTDLGSCIIDKDIFDFSDKRNKIRNVNFTKSNLSEVIVRKTEIKECIMSDSKTGMLNFNECIIDGFKVEGESKNLCFRNNKELKNLDFENAILEGMQFQGDLEEKNKELTANGIKPWW